MAELGLEVETCGNEGRAGAGAGLGAGLGGTPSCLLLGLIWAPLRTPPHFQWYAPQFRDRCLRD